VQSDIASHPRYAHLLHPGAEKYAPLLRAQIERVAAHVPEHIRVARYSYVFEYIYHTLAASNQRVAIWLESIGESPAGWNNDDLIDMLTGAIIAPVYEH